MVRSEVSIPEIIDDLYAGTLDEVRWKRALLNATNLVRGASSLLFAMNPQATGKIVREESYRLDPLVAKANREYWALRDIRIPAGIHVPVDVGQFESKFMRLSAWRRTEIFNDFLLHADVPYSLAFWLHKSTDKVAAFVVQATLRRGPFDEKDDYLLRPLMPHLRRAMEIRDRLEAKQLRSDTFATCMDRVSFGVVVLDEQGRILETNAFTERLLKTETAVRRDPDRTLWLRGDAGVELRRWIVTGVPSTNFTQGTLPVHRSDGRQPLCVLITPLPNSPMSWLTANPRWLVLLFDPEQRIQPVAETLAHELGITSREAELTALLSIGCDLQNVAQRLGISVHTVRTHLKSIFAKTGIHSQTELVRRALSGVAAHVQVKK